MLRKGQLVGSVLWNEVAEYTDQPANSDLEFFGLNA
jgi:hypothetical protein